MNITEVHSLPMDSSKTIFMKNVNVSKEEIIANQAVLHSIQPMRNLPNILRNNTRVYRNDKTLTSDKIDISFASNKIEDANTSLELNTTLSSIDSEKETSYDKITSPKSHQRKQVHSPLDIQYDMPDSNNNIDEKILQKVQLNTLHASPSHAGNIPRKKLKYNEHKRCLFNKKIRRVTARKSSSRKQIYDKSDSDARSTIFPDVNMKDNIVVQNANNSFINDVLNQSICESNTSKYINDLNCIDTKSDQLSNIFYCNDETHSFEKKYNVNHNPVISEISTEFYTKQYNIFQRDLTNYQSSITENGLKEELINRDISSNILFDSKVLYNCACANCTSSDKDIIFYDDPTSVPTSSGMETELFTPYIYNSVAIDYYHILGDSWLMEFDKNNFLCGEAEEMNIIEDTCTGNNGITKLIEDNANMSSVEQSKIQYSQSCHIDRIQDICIESYSTEPVTHSNTVKTSLKSTKNIKVFNKMDDLNIENIPTKEVISQDEVLMQTISTDVPISESKCQLRENKKDLYVIQCAQCGRLFNHKLKFRKHFTHCNFYKEDFECHVCNKIYRHKSSLLQHLRIVHQISCRQHEKSYICNKCSKSYIRLHAFQRHVLLHEDE